MELSTVDEGALAVDEQGIVVKGHNILEEIAPLWVKEGGGTAIECGCEAWQGEKPRGKAREKPHCENGPFNLD